MFDTLTEKFTNIFTSLTGKKRLTEDNISEAVREVRLALLDADVNYGVAKNFIKRVRDKALGDEVIKSVTPSQQFIKLIHEELIVLMGGGEAVLHLQAKPSVLLLCGLQGAGKTTHAAKLAKFLAKGEYRKKVLLAACDLQRPAAVEQLKILGAQIGIEVFSITGEKNAIKVAKAALKSAIEEDFDVLILDTAGRLHVDEELMQELIEIKAVTKPHEVLFVANAATGQDAVIAAAEFNRRLGVTGTILTMLDGDTRAGAAISIHEVTGQPLKFEGIGEKLDDLQLFNAKSMADRILGMGDTINLVKKAKEHITEEEAQKFEEKMRKANFTYNDYLKQMQTVRKMGSLKGLMKMLPGASKFADFDMPEKEFHKIEAIILSMTSEEREEREELTLSRIKRIARGSGTSIQDVNKLKKTFKHAKQFFKHAHSKKFMDKFLDGASF